MWYPADPYENYGSDDYLIEMMGWSQRIRERLEKQPLVCPHRPASGYRPHA